MGEKGIEYSEEKSPSSSIGVLADALGEPRQGGRPAYGALKDEWVQRSGERRATRDSVRCKRRRRAN